MRKLLVVLCAGWVLGSTISYAQNDFYYNIDTTTTPTTDIEEFVHDEVVDEPTGFMQRLLILFGLDEYASGTNPVTGDTQGATNYVKALINMAIALAGFIALVVLIYGFAQMLFTEEEEGFAKAKSYVRGASIALGLMALSWFIVSFIFYVYTTVSL